MTSISPVTDFRRREAESRTQWTCYGDITPSFVDEIEATIRERLDAFTFDADIQIYVPEMIICSRFPGSDEPGTMGVHLRQAQPSYDDHVIVVSGFAWEWLPTHSRNAVIGHELCHIEAAERGGLSAAQEDAPTFRDELEKHGYPLYVDRTGVDVERFVDDHPDPRDNTPSPVPPIDVTIAVDD